MRMRPLSDERGATAIYFAVTMTVFFGMLALTVDIGGVLVARRNIVRAADAAALAAAQSCARGQGLGVAGAQASSYATANQVGSTGGIIESVNCTATALPGHVTVSYAVPYELRVASFLGLEDPDIDAEATAGIFMLGSGRALPVMIWDLALQECNFPETAPASPQQEVHCSLLWDNDQIGDSRWGFMNLDSWNIPATTSCPSDVGASTLSSWMPAGYPSALALNFPQPTYVCSGGGLKTSVWESFMAEKGKIKLFPINDPPTQIPPAPGTPDKYNIVGFTALRIVDGGKVNKPPDTHGTCSVSHPGPIAAGMIIDLQAMGTAAGCFSSPIKDVTAAEFKSANGNTTFATPKDYTRSGAVVTWGETPHEGGLSISFTYSQDSKASCGTQTTANASAYCLVVSWPGPQLGTGDLIEEVPLTGTDQFVMRGIRIEE